MTLKVVEEYCWAITRVPRWSCCGRSSSSVPEFGFKLDSLVWKSTVNSGFRKIRLATDLPGGECLYISWTHLKLSEHSALLKGRSRGTSWYRLQEETRNVMDNRFVRMAVGKWCDTRISNWFQSFLSVPFTRVTGWVPLHIVVICGISRLFFSLYVSSRVFYFMQNGR